jgi:hypothetical protein
VTRTFTAYLAVTTGKLGKNLFSRNRFAAISLSNRKKQLRFLFRREVEAVIVIFGKDRYRGTLLKGEALNNDLSADHFSGCHFHIAEDTLVRIPLRRDAQQRDEVNRPAATGVRQIEGPYRRVRLNAWLGHSGKYAF